MKEIAYELLYRNSHKNFCNNNQKNVNFTVELLKSINIIDFDKIRNIKKVFINCSYKDLKLLNNLNFKK